MQTLTVPDENLDKAGDDITQVYQAYCRAPDTRRRTYGAIWSYYMTQTWQKLAAWVGWEEAAAQITACKSRAVCGVARYGA